MAESGTGARPRIAVSSGPTATIQNSEPLVTSNKARQKYGLPLRMNPDGTPMRFDVLRPQRLAAPVTVYVEQFSAHPLERDAAELYGPPDGYLDSAGVFHKERTVPSDKPVYEVTLKPEDGLYSLPYMARQANGQAWEMDGTEKNVPAELCRVPFFPDGSRLFEEIDRLGISDEGVGCLLTAKADFDFYRALPSGGYAKGRSAGERTDAGDGDITPEVRGIDFFPYRPGYLRKEPPMAALARLTNVVQRALSSGKYLGGIWLEGSPFVEETTYWLNLLIDTTLPIVGNSSQRPHGAIGNDGDRNIVDSVDYITSRIWADEDGRDCVGAVAILDELIGECDGFTERSSGFKGSKFKGRCHHRADQERCGRIAANGDPESHDRQACALFAGRYNRQCGRRSRYSCADRKESSRCAVGWIGCRGFGALRRHEQFRRCGAQARDVQRHAGS